MTLKGLGSPPAFPTTFRDQDGQHQERKDGQWHTVKTDSEVLIDKLGELNILVIILDLC